MTTITPKDADLLPCPFCGGSATVDHDDNGWNWVECSNCGASTNAKVSAMDDCRPLLVEAWNRRAALAAQPSGPAWHDAPNAPGDWVSKQNNLVRTFDELDVAGLEHLSIERGWRWFGPISPDTEDAG